MNEWKFERERFQIFGQRYEEMLRDLQERVTWNYGSSFETMERNCEV